MENEKSFDARQHSENLRNMLDQVIDHARSDIDKVTDPRARGLFETTAEVLIGRRKALEDFENGAEAAWKRAS